MDWLNPLYARADVVDEYGCTSTALPCVEVSNIALRSSELGDFGKGGDRMTLDETIQYHEEVAEEKEKLANTFESFKDYGNPKSSITSGHDKCLECAAEHRQLAAWLRELKAARETLNAMYGRVGYP